MKKLIYLFLILFSFICYGQPAFKVDSITLGTNLINQNNILVTNNFFNKIEIEKGLETEITAQIKNISGTNNISISNGYYQVFSLTGSTEFTIDDKNSESELGQFKIYLYASINSFTFNTNYFDDSTITNLSISTNGVTILSIVKPPYADKWFVDQYKQYNENLIPENTLKQGLVGYWPFDDDANDYSDNGNNGIIHGTISYSSGKVNNAINLNQTGYINVNPLVEPPTGSLSRTISAWIKPFSSHNGTILKYGINNNSYKLCRLMILGPPYNKLWFNGYYADVLDGDFLINDWTHVVFTYNGTKGKIYKNGNFEVENEITLNTPSQTEIEIGKMDQEAFFNGILDEVSLWNRVLSTNEILQLYNNGNGLSLK